MYDIAYHSIGTTGANAPSITPPISRWSLNKPDEEWSSARPHADSQDQGSVEMGLEGGTQTGQTENERCY